MISHVALTVTELSRSVEFYEKVLHFKPIGSHTIESPTAGLLFGMTDADPKLSVEIALLTLSDEVIELMEFENSAPVGEIPADSASNDHWFQHSAIVVANMDTAYEHLKMFDIEPISPAPQTLPDYLEAAGISAFYFKDPDGHVLELIHFPIVFYLIFIDTVRRSAAGAGFSVDAARGRRRFARMAADLTFILAIRISNIPWATCSSWASRTST